MVGVTTTDLGHTTPQREITAAEADTITMAMVAAVMAGATALISTAAWAAHLDMGAAVGVTVIQRYSLTPSTTL